MKSALAITIALGCLIGCNATRKTPNADFVVTDKPIGHPIAGFGACMNPYLYAYPNMPMEISPEAVKDLEAKVKALHPQFVRVFFLQSWWDKDTDPSIAKNHPGMRDSLLLDGYSIHSYWDYWRIGTFRQHIREVAAVIDDMPPKQRRPVYVTEFGASGFRERPGIEPGISDTGKPLCDVPVYSFEIGIF